MARSGASTKKTEPTPEPVSRISRGTIIGVLAAVIVVAAVVAIEASTQDFREGGLPQFSEVSVSGAGLPAYVAGQSDPGIGAVAATRGDHDQHDRQR